jgi:hypothetical protein
MDGVTKMKYRIIFYNAAGELHDIVGDLSLRAVMRHGRVWFETRPTPWNEGSLTVRIEEQK